MGCPIRKSRDHRSLAAPPSLSQLATSFIACDAKVSTCALLCTLTYASRRSLEPNETFTVFFFEIASARARKYAHGPLSCLAHESSSLCSFQRSEGAGTRDSRSPFIECESSLEVVPSKLSSTAGCINRVALDLYREALLAERGAQTIGLSLTERNDRASILSSTLAINGRRTPG